MAGRVDEIEIRPADVERDAALIRSLDTSFETGVIFDVQTDGSGFRLVEKPVDPPVAKSFPLDDVGGGREWESAWLALDRGQAVGVVATQYEGWNRRAIIWHLYVTADQR